MKFDHDFIVSPIWEGYHFVTKELIPSSPDHYLTALEHLLYRAEDYRKQFDFEYYNECDELERASRHEQKRDIRRLVRKINTRIEAAQYTDSDSDSVPDPETLLYEEILGMCDQLIELRKCRGDFTREARLREEGRERHRQRTQRARTRMI
jgi:hypothetical protein